jgi:hypothetical protein
MKNTSKGIINPVSRKNLRCLIKLHGLQSWMFDKNRLFFEWKGLEYEFYVCCDTIHLERINIQKEVILADFDNLKYNIQSPKKPELPDFLK